MRASTSLLTFSGLVSLGSAAYTLQDDYSVNNFFSMFDFFTADDPTHGYVNYVDESTATAAGLAGIKNGQVYMGVDSAKVASGRGRDSVRITSKASYNAGSLIILDLSHMPGSICGTWPAFWTFGPNWPSSGEIDIIEGVNSQNYNHYALHTSSGCSISNTGLFSGSIVTPNCDVNAPGQPNNAGCSIVTSDTTSYGDGFNAQQGGVYATEFTETAISIWYFPRSQIPSDISSGNPEPSGWGVPHASFGSPCQIGNYIRSQNIIFDVTFCGDWAGNVWSTDATCSSKASTCQDFVQNNPSAFQESYWSINSLRVYTGSGSGGPVPGPSGSESYRPTVMGGVPTDHSSFGVGVPTAAGSVSGWSQPSAQAQPQPQPEAVPDSQDDTPQWGGGRNVWDNRDTVFAWDGESWQQPTVANAAVSPVPTSAAAAGGQFYELGSQLATGLVASSVDANVNANANANVNAAVETASATAGSVGTPQPYVASAGETRDADAVDQIEDVNMNIDTSGAQPQSQPQPQSQQDSPAPTLTSPSLPSKTCNEPWIRSSWSGRYVTMTAMAERDSEFAKREVAAGELVQRGAHENRDEDEDVDVDGVKRWVVFNDDEKEEEGTGEPIRGAGVEADTRRREKRHLHRHVNKRRGLGTW